MTREPAETFAPTVTAQRRDLTASRLRGVHGWRAAVAASTTFVVVAALALAVGWLVSGRSQAVTYSVSRGLTRVDLALSSGDAVVVGSSSSTLQVRRVDDYAFGHAAREQRSLVGGVLRISSRCPKIVLGSCSSSYELEVPQSVAVDVRTGAGEVRMTGFSGDASIATRSGSVDVEAYCGFSLAAHSAMGDLHVATACAPQRLDLVTGSGDAVALVPPGRYRIGASSGTGRASVSGVARDERAPFTIDVHSSSGRVSVEGGL